MSAPSVSPPRPGPPTDGLPLPRRYWAIAAILLAIAMSVLDSTIVNIALPSIARDFGATSAASIWVVNAYQLAILVVLLPLSSLGEVVGYRRVSQAGLAVFTLASLACAWAPTLLVLSIARLVQGLGAAGIVSVSGALVREAHQRTAHAHDAGGPQALDEARDTEDEQRGRPRAGERGEREHCQPGLGDAPVAHDLSEGGERQQYHQDRQLVGVDHPDRGGGRGAEVARDGGQGDVDDGAVEHRHRDREQDGRDSPVAAWQRQAVRRRAGARGADAWSGHPA